MTERQVANDQAGWAQIGGRLASGINNLMWHGGKRPRCFFLARPSRASPAKQRNRTRTCNTSNYNQLHHRIASLDNPCLTHTLVNVNNTLSLLWQICTFKLFYTITQRRLARKKFNHTSYSKILELQSRVVLYKQLIDLGVVILPV